MPRKHVHAWTPLDGQYRRYACACWATGYRSSSGEIVAHETPLKPRAELTVKPSLHHGPNQRHDGKVPPKPTSRG